MQWDETRQGSNLGSRGKGGFFIACPVGREVFELGEDYAMDGIGNCRREGT